MASILKCRFCEPTENFTDLSTYLPHHYEYVLCHIITDGSSSNFKARLRTSCQKQDQAQKWLEEFEMQSKCTMRVDRTYPRSGTKNVYKVDLRCQHNTRPRNEKAREKDSKNTDCPAKMVITIKRIITERKSRSKDPHLPDYPTLILIDFCHNHAINSPEILKHRSVLPEVKDKLLTLFKLGHNPATALDMHKYDLLLEHGDNFKNICHDRALLPDSQYCYRLYYKILRKQSIQVESEKHNENSFLVPLTSCENSSLANDGKKKKTKLKNGVFSKKEIPPQLEEILCKFCESGGFAGVQVLENNTVMALCTPLMLRVHTLVKQSAQLVFLDAYGDLNEPESCLVYLFLTYCSAGPVPLGCIVTTSASANCIKAALDLWKQIVPKGLFYNRSEGPYVFFTNDNDAERQGLKLSFPKSHLLICSSHILQASWMFLLDHRNIIKKEHRSTVLSKIKMLLFSQTVEDLQMNYTCAIADPLIKSNTVFLDYIKSIYNHRYDWSFLYWRHLLPHGNDFSMFWESSLILQKDPILSRAKTFNALQIVDFLPRLDTYYERKLIDLANSRLESVRVSRFMFIDIPKEAYVITQNSEIDYEVHNDVKDVAYQVDISLGVCECRTGKAGAPCKHQLLIFHNFPIPIFDCVPPSSPAEKSLLLQLATSQDLAKELTPEAVLPVAPESCNPGIAIQDIDACGGGDYFLDENGLNANHQTLISQIHASILSQSVVIPPTSANPEPCIEDGMLPSANLLATQTISLLEPLMLDQPNLEPLCPKEDESSVSQIIDKICLQLKRRTGKSPAAFRPALGTFLKNLESLNSNSSLEYALYSFGKFSKFNTPLFKRKIIDNKLIGMQSTGKIKRKKNATIYS